MRLLIDGYNLMYAAGLLGTRLGIDGLRKVRARFLNDLAGALDPVDAHQTTIVFDATDPPPHLDTHARHKGMTILFAVDENDADERIEALIRAHSDPKRLDVVSSDNRIKLAANRRGAKSTSCDEFLDRLDALKAARARKTETPVEPPERPSRISESESRYWIEQFREIEDSPEFQKAVIPDPMLTDLEIRKIAEEVEKEDGTEPWNRSKGRKPPPKR